MNGFLADTDRDLHYLPEIAGEYHQALASFRPQLIARTAMDESFALYQYLTEHQMIQEDEIDLLLKRAGRCKDPEIISLLLSYKHTRVGKRSFAGSLTQAIGEL